MSAQQPLQLQACPALDLDRAPQVVGRSSQAIGVRPVVLDHAVKVERLFGEFYGVCATCGARSLPVDREADIQVWSCPIGDAEREVARNLRLFDARFKAAQASGYFR